MRISFTNVQSMSIDASKRDVSPNVDPNRCDIDVIIPHEKFAISRQWLAESKMHKFPINYY